MQSEIVTEIAMATNMEVTLKDELCDVVMATNDEVTIKEELPKSVEDVGVHTLTEDYEEFGNIDLSVEETKLCMSSISTGYHVERKNGVFRGHVSFRGPLSSGDTTWLRCTLIRQDPAYRHFVVDTVCPKHRSQLSPQMVPHVIRAVTQPNVTHKYEIGYRPSVLFSGESSGDGWNTNMALWFVCSDTCWTTRDTRYHGKEASRDLFLMLTVESQGRVFGRKLVSVFCCCSSEIFRVD